ncbi:hypothetical protein GOBAR_AA11376 [Gossypium barbadense]|uniref:Peroxin/Ferlin domain-containing protein n=1 Tax=Gossypium barbadense TaxID=3634 RepID=A0A2P5Y122_GOSBA|nr:hypothetical protein GOBAR_AA11376 [Gossypium barbadense]
MEILALCMHGNYQTVLKYGFTTVVSLVVSLEFTFFDGTKSYLDDSSYGEKLLRAKMDLNFMYAYKENDTWIRTVVKDLTVETGSGLIILDPLDISGGYTSVKEKTNISLISTDICIHLSLGGISLLLNLQYQAAAALQFGNASPLAPCINFDRIWVSPKENGSHNNLIIWRPQAPSNYVILGDCVTSRLEPPALGIILKSEDPEISAKPVQFTKVAHIAGKGFDEVFFWYPIAPPGYASLGCIVSRTDEAPCMDFLCCPRMDLVSPTNIIELPISRYLSSKASHCWSIWKVENQASTFLARSDIKMPSMRLAYTISDSVKHKTRENVTAEIKLRFFSLTVLDSLHGMMTPLFEVTIANIKLVTHGRLEAMNAVFISSIAASTFNKHLEAWEPLVEPFDGIFKFETYDINVNSSSIIGKRMHIAATNIVNINVRAMNLDTLIETILSWRRQLELDQKATKLIEEAGAHSGNEDLAFSALDEEDLQTLVVENQLGSDLYIKRIEQNSEVVDQLHHGGFASVWVPPARFSDRLNVAEESRQARYYVAAQILFAKDLPIVDDGNSHNFFCALRLVIDSQATDQQKLFPQSARTKCVKPLVSDKVYPKKGIAKWNELFIFEVPRKGVAKLEVEVTNLSAKAGKGEVVGALSFPIGQRANILKKLSSSRMLPPRNDTQNIESYSLRRKVHSNNVEDTHGHVKIFVSTSYFERNTTAIFQRDAESRDASDKDIGFWVRLGSEGSWESVRSLLPLSVVPKSFQSEFIAMEVVMRNGKKHAIFRGLATVVNDSDVNLDISVCHVSMTQDSGSNTPNIVVEEIFENQRYHPISGWGNKWPGFQGSDPACWSTRDFSCSSKEFFEPSLPNGWEWISTWTIDKSQFVDDDGWAYAADYPNQWPPTSSKLHIKSGHDVVRRRRWIRTKQLIAEKEKCCVKNDFTTINPGCSTVLSWGSTSKASDQCLRIRPSADYPHPPYAWGHTVVVAVASNFASGKDQPFVDQCYIKSTSPEGSKKPNFALLLNQLEKKDILLCCSPTVESRQIWLSVGADASALHTEFNHPVYNWRISVNSPLKLENRLSCPAEFTIWEKTKDRNYIEREHGIISSRMSAHIYSVDIQRPIYLSFLVQSDWVLEKDPVLILDLSSSAHISSFWMLHQQKLPYFSYAVYCAMSGSISLGFKRLRVSVERDMGGTGAAPKTIRFFVPYWIINDSALPLAYQVVEIEGSDNADMDSRSSKAVKSTRTVLRTPSYLTERRHSGPRRNIQVLEAIEDTSPIASMLSPQDSAGRSGVTLFTAQKDTYVSPRIGIAVALRDSEIYSPGISLLELEKKERFDVKAFSSEGYYYKLSALVNMTTDRTKVIHLQPYMLFVNRVGLSFCLQQCYSETVEWIHPTDPPKLLGWQSSSKVELLKVDGYGWSKPFSVSTEGVMRISLKNDTGSDHLFLKIEVRSGTKSSRYEVIFRPNSSSSPYRHIRVAGGLVGSVWIESFGAGLCQVKSLSLEVKWGWIRLGCRCSGQILRLWIENRSIFLPILFQQVDGTSDSWHFLLPNTAVSFLWEDLGRRHLLEILADGADPSRSGKYNIDEIFDHLPIDVAGPAQALRITILKEEKVNVVKISDWMPENEPPVIISQMIPSTLSELSRSESHQQQPRSTSECEFHFIVEFAELGVSIIDHTPEEILYLSLQNVHLAYSSGLGSGLSRFKLRMRGIQMDNQLPLTPTPVLFRPQKIGQETDYILKISVTLQTKGSLDLSVYPYIGFHGPDNSAFLINIHEPIIWRIHEMMQQVNLSRLSDSNTTAVSFDPIIHIGILNISEVRLKVSMAMSPSQRPRGVLGFWSSLMTALGNTENMTSMMINNAISNIKNDLLGQSLRLLSGLDILSNASSALGHMSKGVAALSMDKKFIQSRQRQKSMMCLVYWCLNGVYNSPKP